MRSDTARAYLRADRFIRNGLTAAIFTSIMSLPASGAVIAYSEAEFLSMPTHVQTASLDAAFRMGILFSNNVNVNVRLNHAPLSAGVLAQAGSYAQLYSYSDVRAALASSLGIVGASLLQTGTSFRYLTNGNGTVQTSNTVQVNSATAKALGLIPNNTNVVDADITFSSSFSFDFGPTDGILSGHFDYVGVLMHEIGHALGFRSSTDGLDQGLSRSAPTLQDLFRFSDQSVAVGQNLGIEFMPDISADSRSKYFLSNLTFSKDGNLLFDKVQYSTGKKFGDGRQNSHWKDNLGIGIMDPTSSAGESNHHLSGYDIEFFDYIGWDIQRIFDKLGNPSVPFPGPLDSFVVCDEPVSDLDCSASSVPEPSTVGLLGIGLLMLLFSFGKKTWKREADVIMLLRGSCKLA